MAQPSDEGFRVTDRRHRDASDAPSSPTTETPRSQPATPPTAPIPPSPKERSLVGLFVMLASEALIALGDAPDPVSGQQQAELPHASAIIDLLTLLRDKTEGHRSADESRTLDDLIYDLQVRYVKAAKSPR
jgi:Domain of unknown function (DUF1844)